MLALVALVVVLAGIIAAQVQWADGAKWTPRLGLDLEGGTQIILAPVVQGGGKVTPETLQQSVDIIRARVDGSGVGEAEITTEGGHNIVVAEPGKIDDKQRNLIKQSSQLRFRAVFAMSRFNRFSIGIPASIGTSGLSATLTPRWTNRATRVRR